MQYGYFDDRNREYVITRPDIPVSWTNYLGCEKTGTVISHNAGGYMFHESAENHRITRFRANGVPLDRPGHYVYLRDDDTSDYWSVSWQPVAKSLSKARYEVRHGMSYSIFKCSYNGIKASQKLFIPIGDAVELWDITVKNTTSRERNISLFPYCEFSFNLIEIDNQNLQMSLYSQGSRYEDGVIEIDNFYDPDMYHYFTSSFTPDGFDSVRDTFIGVYNTETDPEGVKTGIMHDSVELGGNHCGAFRAKVTLAPREEKRFIVMLGVGNLEEGRRIKAKYSSSDEVDKAFRRIRRYWADKCSCLQIDTPNKDMNTMINIWDLYQSETNVNFSRFSSFIEVGGRTGLGYRDTAQDAMCIPHSAPRRCRERIEELLRGLTEAGYGLHLFEPDLFNPEIPKKEKRPSPTVKPEPEKGSLIHGLKDTCSDDALWLVGSVCEYVKETGDLKFFDRKINYAEGSFDTVYGHLKRILDFSAEQVGESGICKGLRADWNDCLNLGGGESALTSFLHYWATSYFIEAAAKLGRSEDELKYTALKEKIKEACECVLWDKEWYIRGITKSGRKIGTSEDVEGKVHLESNSWAVLSGAASPEHAAKAVDAIDKYLYSEYGIHLNAPSFGTPDDEIGFVTRVYKGVKENGAIFSHPNPWAWAAAALLGQGDRAMKYYNALCPARQNDMIEIRQAEPYSYCQFIMGRDHSAFGRARHPWLTGSAGWAYFSATRYMLGVRPDYDELVISPAIPHEWDGFRMQRKWRGATYLIEVKNPEHKESGVREIYLNGEKVDRIPPQKKGTTVKVEVIM